MTTAQRVTVTVASSEQAPRFPSPGAPQTPTFASMLERRTVGGATARSQVRREAVALADDAREIERGSSRLAAGEPMSRRELIELQETMYRYNERVDVATRVVGQAASGLRQLLTVQL
ncbi:MAG: hypothetical protein H6698_02595 [Myxococcales bacterium]|nr:hypothetical protein [Myxococcales bacterium]MCB9519891.1 hypothetical protein [Myxococcales bacterium]MCB9533202.1 hypothetical protein [Myxococcales bacterium]